MKKLYTMYQCWRLLKCMLWFQDQRRPLIQSWYTQQWTCSLIFSTPCIGWWAHSHRNFMFSFYSSTDRTLDTVSQIICHRVSFYILQSTTRTPFLPAAATETGEETRHSAHRCERVMLGLVCLAMSVLWLFFKVCRVKKYLCLEGRCQSRYKATGFGTNNFALQYSHCKYITFHIICLEINSHYSYTGATL